MPVGRIRERLNNHVSVSGRDMGLQLLGRAGGPPFGAILNFRVADPSRVFEGSEGLFFRSVRRPIS